MTQYDTILSDLLSELGVPHTRCWSNEEFCKMPFQSLFGLKKLLQQYGVESEGLQFEDKSQFRMLPVPFLASVTGGYVIVTRIGDSSVEYISDGERLMMRRSEFEEAWNGVALVAYPDADACEPDYRVHRVSEIATEAKKYVLWGGILFLIAYMFVAHGLWHNAWNLGVMAVDAIGILISYMLLQKTLNIKNRAADRVCGVIQEGGCDHVLSLKASKFFGLFSWSEVGMSYFVVSLVVLLLNPDWLPELAAINMCCLPFTFWSVWYQKFRAHHWCTLCLSVQVSLWLLFLCYLCGGWVGCVAKLDLMRFVALGAVYLVALLGLNRVMPMFDKNEEK